MRQILVRRDLDGHSCDVPGCTHSGHPEGLALHAVCHPAATLQVFYAEGVLTVKCGSCKSVVCCISVGSVHLNTERH